MAWAWMSARVRSLSAMRIVFVWPCVGAGHAVAGPVVVDGAGWADQVAVEGCEDAHGGSFLRIVGLICFRLAVVGVERWGGVLFQPPTAWRSPFGNWWQFATSVQPPSWSRKAGNLPDFVGELV